MKRISIAAALLLSLVSSAHAAEGKWTPQQVLELDAAALKKEGLELPPSRLWDPKSGTGLLAGAVNIGGCSGGFISPTGLIITNHHCVFSILQEHATPQNDVITNGFVAASREQELSGKSLRVSVTRKLTDVTPQIVAAVPQGASDTERSRAIETKETELITACEKQPSTRCRVAHFDGGLQYVLVDSLELSDVRLVYAPPRAIGEYGGEVDNWMWPRHTGDFAIARAYVAANGAAATYSPDNVPYHSTQFFPISTKGASPGDFVMVLGYPGITYRSLTSDEMRERRDVFFARRRDVYGEWLRILDESTRGNADGAIAVADHQKTLANRFKNAEGQLAGFQRWAIVEKQAAADQAVIEWAATRAQYRDAADAHAQLATLINEQLRTSEKDFLLSNIVATQAAPSPMGPKSLYFATTVVRSAIERQKPEAQRDALYTVRNISRVGERLEREQKSWFDPADQRLVGSIVRRALALPATQRIAAIDTAFTSASTESAIAAHIAQMTAQSRVLDVNERAKMLAETPEQLHARHDPLLELAFALDPELRDYLARRDRWDGSVTRLRPIWRRAVLAHAGKPVAPDANSTLRVSFAHVQGYVPRDGAIYTPQTTLSGVLEKNTGEEPFAAPARIVDAARRRDFGRWKDAKLNDVPVDFLADADTTGGNSGSPVVNGRGELVGVNFDRVWENVANDFAFLPQVGRNVSVDIRYLLWILDRVDHAGALLREIGAGQ